MISLSAIPQNDSWPKVRPAIFRHLVFPAYCHLISWERADAIFRAEGKTLLQLARALPAELLAHSVRIEPYPGIDDNRRQWSAEMILGHLIVLGSYFAEIMVDLSQGQKPSRKLDVQGNAPEESWGGQILEDFQHFLDDYENVLAEGIGDRNSSLTYPHPSLGELNSRQWHCLAAFHQTIHCIYMQRIVCWNANGTMNGSTGIARLTHSDCVPVGCGRWTCPKITGLFLETERNGDTYVHHAP